MSTTFDKLKGEFWDGESLIHIREPKPMRIKRGEYKSFMLNSFPCPFEQKTKYSYLITVRDLADGQDKLLQLPRHMMKEMYKASEYLRSESEGLPWWKRLWNKLTRKKYDTLADKVITINSETIEGTMIPRYNLRLEDKNEEA